jgi:hypothetical protein
MHVGDPGVQRDEETRISIPVLFVRSNLTKESAVGKVVQLGFTPTCRLKCPLAEVLVLNADS